MKCCEFPFVVTSQKMNAAKCCYLPSAVTTLRLEILCLVCFKLRYNVSSKLPMASRRRSSLNCPLMDKEQWFAFILYGKCETRRNIFRSHPYLRHPFFNSRLTRTAGSN